MTAAGFLRTDGPTKAAAVRKLEQQTRSDANIFLETLFNRTTVGATETWSAFYISFWF